MPFGALPEVATQLLSRLTAQAEAEGLALFWPGKSEPVAELLCGPSAALDEIVRHGPSALPKPKPGGQGSGFVGGRPVVIVCFALSGAETGALMFWRCPGAPFWDAAEFGIVTAAATAAQMFLHASVEQELAQGLIDPLTRLPTRTYFLEEARRHIARLDREALPGSILLIELDDADRFRGSFGRATTDRMLRQIAARLRATVRPSDLVGRMGAVSFAVWLAGADHLVTAERAEALRINPIAPLRSDDLLRRRPVTLSLGIATRWPGNRQTISTLLGRARDAADEARRRGGAQWCVAPDPVV